MSKGKVELLVLDVHGVVLSDYLPSFLAELAARTGQCAHRVQLRWRRELRRAAWTGEIEDAELWQRLTDDAGGGHWRDLLEAGYRLGPAAGYLPRWSRRVPVWLLSNHRTHWLMPRLHRFGLAGYFQRVLVSDALGAAKPEARAFGPVLAGASEPGAALFVDNSESNAAAANKLGLQVVHAGAGRPWLVEVEALLFSQA